MDSKLLFDLYYVVLHEGMIFLLCTKILNFL